MINNDQYTKGKGKSKGKNNYNNNYGSNNTFQFSTKGKGKGKPFFNPYKGEGKGINGVEYDSWVESDQWQQSYPQPPHIEFCALEICPIEHNDKQNHHDSEDDETHNTDDHIDITINKRCFYELFAIKDYVNIANYIYYRISETSMQQYKNEQEQVQAQYDDNIVYSSNTPSRDADTSSNS